MTNFRTEIKLSKAVFEISYQDKIVSMGSCFANHIGQKLREHQFNTIINPLGIVFHPLPLLTNLLRILNNKPNPDHVILKKDGYYVSYNHHSKLHHAFKEQLQKLIREKEMLLLNELTSANHLILTLGTAWAYRHRDYNQIVVNCHKQDQKYFKKELTSITHISEHTQALLNALWQHNPTLNIIFTVSPVRHWKDGAVNNARSKAHLLSAVHQICDANSRTAYFPSFELMMDDLRDYRFYKSDMLHPGKEAIQYVWEKFQQWCMNEAIRNKLQLAYKIHQLKNHRSMQTIPSANHQEKINIWQDQFDKM